MEFFTDGAFVRLESRVMTGKYVSADADWQRISLRPNVGTAGADPALNSVWRVQRWVHPEDGDTYVALQNAAFGRYLSFSRNPAQRGHHGCRTTQMDRSEPDELVGMDLNRYPWLWTVERLPDPDQDYVSLRYFTCYLRANGSRYLFHLFWNNIRVTTDTDLDAPEVSDMMHWKVHQVEASPVPRVLALAREDEDEESESGLRPPARTIRHVLADDEGKFDENHHNWASFAFMYSSVDKLRYQLKCLQHWNADGAYTMCMRPGSHGRLMPLVSYALPDSSESMDIVVFRNESPAAMALRYPAPPGSG